MKTGTGTQPGPGAGLGITGHSAWVHVCEGDTLAKAPSRRGRFSPRSCAADRSLTHVLTKLTRLETGQSADLSEKDRCQEAPRWACLWLGRGVSAWEAKLEPEAQLTLKFGGAPNDAWSPRGNGVMGLPPGRHTCGLSPAVFLLPPVGWVLVIWDTFFGGGGHLFKEKVSSSLL